MNPPPPWCTEKTWPSQIIREKLCKSLEMGRLACCFLRDAIRYQGRGVSQGAGEYHRYSEGSRGIGEGHKVQGRSQYAEEVHGVQERVIGFRGGHGAQTKVTASGGGSHSFDETPGTG